MPKLGVIEGGKRRAALEKFYDDLDALIQAHADSDGNMADVCLALDLAHAIVRDGLIYAIEEE